MPSVSFKKVKRRPTELVAGRRAVAKRMEETTHILSHIIRAIVIRSSYTQALEGKSLKLAIELSQWVEDVTSGAPLMSVSVLSVFNAATLY